MKTRRGVGGGVEKGLQRKHKGDKVQEKDLFTKSQPEFWLLEFEASLMCCGKILLFP